MSAHIRHPLPWGAAGLCVALCAAGAVATAAPSGPGVGPPLHLRAEGHRQAGNLVFAEWSEPRGDGCVGISIDGRGGFPKRPLRVSTVGKPRFVFRTADEPELVDVVAWHRLNRRGEPRGSAESVPVTLSPRTGDGGETVAWRAVIAPDEKPRHYLRMYASWPGGPCEGGPNHLLWQFHLAARR